jgi:hypothetical protein
VGHHYCHHNRHHGLLVLEQEGNEGVGCRLVFQGMVHPFLQSNEQATGKSK